MKELYFVKELPKVPAVYAIYGGRDSSYVAYVGSGGDLRQRMEQHLIKRNSTVTTATSASTLNPDYVTGLEWWAHDSFKDKITRLGAEIIASELLKPSLRSRERPLHKAKKLSAEKNFRKIYEKLFTGDPTGKITIPSIDFLYRKFIELENRVKKLETVRMK